MFTSRKKSHCVSIVNNRVHAIRMMSSKAKVSIGALTFGPKRLSESIAKYCTFPAMTHFRQIKTENNILVVLIKQGSGWDLKLQITGTNFACKYSVRHFALQYVKTR